MAGSIKSSATRSRDDDKNEIEEMFDSNSFHQNDTSSSPKTEQDSDEQAEMGSEFQVAPFYRSIYFIVALKLKATQATSAISVTETESSRGWGAFLNTPYLSHWFQPFNSSNWRNVCWSRFFRMIYNLIKQH